MIRHQNGHVYDDIKRWSMCQDGTMEEDKYGDYVLYSDHAKEMGFIAVMSAGALRAKLEKGVK